MLDGKSEYGLNCEYIGGCCPEVLIPSGKTDLGTTFLVFELISCGANVVARAGAIAFGFVLKRVTKSYRAGMGALSCGEKW